MSRPKQPAAFLIGTVCLFLLALPSIAQGQQYQVIHAFQGDGQDLGPFSGLTVVGEKYVAATVGNLFSLQYGDWLYNDLFNLYPGNYGYWPMARPIVGPDGALYGTTYEGGLESACNGNGCGVVYKVQPPPSFCRAVQCYWTYTVLHTFTGGADGGGSVAEVAFDSAGNLYGTALYGGNNPSCPFNYGCGVLFEMSPSGGGWTFNVIYSFTGGNDGANPSGGLTLDAVGDLYGTAFIKGSSGAGVLFRLTHANGGWTQTVLHSFQAATDGAGPDYSLTTDASGNFYGVTYDGGPNGGGTVYEYSLSTQAFSLLYPFALPGIPGGSPALDSAGNLYGVVSHGGDQRIGFIYELSPSENHWIYTDLYDFGEGDNDGGFPFCSLIIDQQGRLYGTTTGGGAGHGGTVWQFTP